MSKRTTTSDPPKEPGRKTIRFVVVLIVVIIFSRQSFLGFSASMKIMLNEGVYYFESGQANTTIDCDSNIGVPEISPDIDASRVLSAPSSTVSTLKIASGPSAPVKPYQGDTNTSTCEGYYFFPIPEHNSGLPYLADAFATRDRTELIFIGNNRGICDPQHGEQDGWMHGNKRFMCAFPDNTMVVSEWVAPTGRYFKNNFMFKCAIPEEFRHLIVPGQKSTNLHFDLHTLHLPEAPKVGMNNHQFFPSQKITDTPKIGSIPVCHAGYADLDKQYELVAYTRTQSSYRTQIDRQGRTYIRSTIHRIQEWMDWHITQGFDHFIIYDHDPEPHGPLEDLTKGYVESGLVTYRWFPMKDCTIVGGKKMGNVKRIGQAAGGLSAMHRLTEKGAKYMAHMDVDEFFVLYNPRMTILDYARRRLRAPVDCISFRPHVLDHCDGAVVQSEADSPVETKQCFTKSHASDLKLIMRMETMSHFQVHYPLLTKSWNTPRQIKIPWNHKDFSGVGMLAHYRGEIQPGVKKTKWTERVPYFDKFLASRNATTVLPQPGTSSKGLAASATATGVKDAKKVGKEGRAAENNDQAESAKNDDAEGKEANQESDKAVEEEEKKNQKSGVETEEGETDGGTEGESETKNGVTTGGAGEGEEGETEEGTEGEGETQNGEPAQDKDEAEEGETGAGTEGEDETEKGEPAQDEEEAEEGEDETEKEKPAGEEGEGQADEQR